MFPIIVILPKLYILNTTLRFFILFKNTTYMSFNANNIILKIMETEKEKDFLLSN